MSELAPGTQVLAALLTRVVSGTGEDRGLDANVALLFGVVIARYRDRSFSLFRRGQNTMFAGGAGDFQNAAACLAGCLSLERYTSSLDAVMTLVERERPGWQWSIASAYPPNRVLSHAQMWTGDEETRASAATPARALLAALIKAKMEESTQ